MKTYCAKCDRDTQSGQKGEYLICGWCKTIKERASISVDTPEVPSVSIDNQKKLF